MPALGGAEILHLAEAGAQAAPLAFADLVLAGSFPDLAPGRLGPGARNRWLLLCHRHAVGESFEGVAACPACGERLEIEIPVAELLSGQGEPAASVALQHGDMTIRLRLPERADIEAAGRVRPGTARRLLVERCIVAAERDGGSCPPPPVDDALAAAAAAAFEAADPLGDIRLGLSCPACGHAWIARLDPLPQLRDALHGQAEQLLHEVDTLARAYGWTEPDILALSRWRRRRYLDLAGT